MDQMSINKENELRVVLVGDAESQETTNTISPKLRENLPAASNEADATFKRIKAEEDHDDQASYDVTKVKKPRLVWTAELHNKFAMAVNQLHPKNAVPKKILECMQNMGVTNLTRENVASHLQKYRIHRRRDHENQRKTLDDLHRMSVEQSNASDRMFESIQSYTCPDQLPFPRLALDSNSNHAPDLPNHANNNPLDSSAQTMKYSIHHNRDHENQRKAFDDLQRISVEQSHVSDGMIESILSYTPPDQLLFPSLTLDSNSNHATDLPNHVNINPLYSSVQAMKYHVHRSKDHENKKKALDDLQKTSVKQCHASDGMIESIQSYTHPGQLPFSSRAPDLNSNHAPNLPNHANINSLDSSVQSMESAHQKSVAHQLSDHNDGTILGYNNWTVPAMQPNLQTNETSAQYFGINTNIRSEAGQSGQIMIDGDENIGNWSFDFNECENIDIANTANCSVENNAAVLEYLRMSRSQYNGIPDLQSTPDRMNSNGTFYGPSNSFVAGPVAGEEYYVNYGINAPYCNDIHVDGNAYNNSQNLVQPEQRYDGNDFMQKPFIQQSGSGLAKTK